MPAEILERKILEQHSAVREAVGFLDLNDRGKIEMTGPDRITFLHAMISNDVAELAELAGRYGTFLTDRGKMVSDFFYYKLPETVLIDVVHDLLPVMKESLERQQWLRYTDGVSTVCIRTCDALICPDSFPQLLRAFLRGVL